MQKAIDLASSGRTCIIVAHRLSTIQKADYIAVIEKGRVTEGGKTPFSFFNSLTDFKLNSNFIGTHQELINKQGLYYSMVMKQNLL